VIVNYLSYALLVVRIIPIFLAAVALLFLSRRIEEAICQVILECSDPCVIEADPDIAGIGVSIRPSCSAATNF